MLSSWKDRGSWHSTLPRSRVMDGLARGLESRERAGHTLGRHRKIGLTILEYCVVSVAASIIVIMIVMMWAGNVQFTFEPRTALFPRMVVDTPTVFREDFVYAPKSRDAGMAAWEALRNNFDLSRVYIKDSSSYGLQPAELNSTVPGYSAYTIALYHQLHCLGTIREHFYTLNIAQEIAYGGHIGHCFDYIRQSLLCSADLTLEHTTVGWDVEHACKNPKEVDHFMAAHNEARARLGH